MLKAINQLNNTNYKYRSRSRPGASGLPVGTPGPDREKISAFSQKISAFSQKISAFSQMMLSCWLLRARTFSSHWGGLQLRCFTAGMRIGTSKSKAGKGWLSSSRSGKSILKLRSSSILESSSGVRMTGG